MGKEMTTCPHCGEVVKKGNFCNKYGKKLAKICDCWLMKRPYNCNFQQCPDMAACTLLLLHIQQDQKRRKYVFLEPILEAINSKSLKAVKKLTMLYNVHTKGMAFFTKLAAGAQWLLNASLWGCPVLVIAGAFAAAGYIIYKDWDKIKQFFVNLWDSPRARTIMFITGSIGWVIVAGTSLIANWDTVKQWFITLWDNLVLPLQQFVDGIKAKFNDAFSWVQEKWQAISDFISKPIFGKVNITAQGSGGNYVAHNASGGIYGKGAFLTTFAENSGESAIPHTPNARNIGLLGETNRIMGNPLGGGANITATFAPNITIQGGGDEGKIREVWSWRWQSLRRCCRTCRTNRGG